MDMLYFFFILSRSIRYELFFLLAFVFYFTSFIHLNIQITFSPAPSQCSPKIGQYRPKKGQSGSTIFLVWPKNYDQLPGNTTANFRVSRWIFQLKHNEMCLNLHFCTYNNKTSLQSLVQKSQWVNMKFN